MSTNGTEDPVDDEPSTPEQKAGKWSPAHDSQDPPAGSDAKQEEQQREEQEQDQQHEQQQEHQEEEVREQEQQQEEEEEEQPDAGTSSFRRKIAAPSSSAAIFESDTGLEYTVPPEIRDAVDCFQPPAGYECVGDREQSFIYSVGNYVQPIDLDSPSKPAYFCQGSFKCRKYKHQIPCTRGSRSNVNKHLQHIHHIRGVSRGAVGQSPARSVGKKLKGKGGKTSEKASEEASEKASASETPDKAKKVPAALGGGRTRCVPDVSKSQRELEVMHWKLQSYLNSRQMG